MPETTIDPVEKTVPDPINPENKEITPKSNAQPKADEDKGDEPTILDGSKYEPPVRSQIKPWSNQEERKQYFEKIHGKQTKKELDANIEEDPDDIDGKPLTMSSIQELFSKQIEQVFQPVFEQVRSTADESELSSFLSKPENSSFKKYEQMARKDMKAYPNVPIDRIFRSLAYDDALALGAAKSKETTEKIEKNKVGGRSSRPITTSNAPDFSKMTDKELMEFNKNIRRGNSVKIEE